MTCLLDVNVLVALMWPAHEAHSAAQAWLAEHYGYSVIGENGRDHILQVTGPGKSV